MNEKYIVRLSDDERGVCQDIVKRSVIGRFKTSHSWALQNQPPLSGRHGSQFDNPQWFFELSHALFCLAQSVGISLWPNSLAWRFLALQFNSLVAFTPLRLHPLSSRRAHWLVLNSNDQPRSRWALWLVLDRLHLLPTRWAHWLVLNH